MHFFSGRIQFKTFAWSKIAEKKLSLYFTYLYVSLKLFFFNYGSLLFRKLEVKDHVTEKLTRLSILVQTKGGPVEDSGVGEEPGGTFILNQTLPPTA